MIYVSEKLVEEYGYAPVQAGWFGSELGDSLSRGTEVSHTKQSGDDQGGRHGFVGSKLPSRMALVGRLLEQQILS
jgi:hypothetical protein